MYPNWRLYYIIFVVYNGTIHAFNKVCSLFFSDAYWIYFTAHFQYRSSIG